MHIDEKETYNAINRPITKKKQTFIHLRYHWQLTQDYGVGNAESRSAVSRRPTSMCDMTHSNVK